jgi:hypothetical protein
MSLPVLKRIRALVDGGATVVGGRPDGTPSLADSAAEFASIADSLWGTGGAAGKVMDAPLEQALRTLSISPDVQFSGASAGSKLYFVHRALDDGDLYFISNGETRAVAIDASFRVSGKAPEIWRAETGDRSPGSYRQESGRTVVPLELGANDAQFVVFRKNADASSREVPKLEFRLQSTLKAAWDVRFQPGHGAPAASRFEALTSWTENSDPGIRYFSGTATYTTNFDAKDSWLKKGSRLRLNLGDARDLVEVSVNGHELGILWKKPFVVDVTDALKAGSNRLEIKVTNVWPNRMVGDKQPGMSQVAFSTFDPYKADSPLLPSGLLGPVILETAN